MTLDEMITDLSGRIGSDPEVGNTLMKTWINQGLLTFCNASDFHWLERVEQASTVASQERYTVPSKFKYIKELKIDGDRYNFVRYEQRDMQPSTKKYYSIFNNEIYINPIPSTTSSSNIEIAYYKRPQKMTSGSDSPSDSSIAGLPEEYHEALVIYAFATYNTYDEEHQEALSLMGSERSPMPGTFNYFVKTAINEEKQRKKGARNRMLSSKEYHGYTRPNETSSVRTVLGN